MPMYFYCPDCPSCVESERSGCVGRKSNGYWVTEAGYAHRIVWMLHNDEEIPEGMCIDHINRDKSDNRIENLRLATPSTNAFNRSRPRRKLVQRLPSGKWRGRTYWNGRTIWTKAYDTKERAHNEALARRLELYWTV